MTTTSTELPEFKQLFKNNQSMIKDLTKGVDGN